METDLFIDLPRSIYRPGETISGQILWALNKSPEKMQLSLGWWTEGRGDRDAKIETELEWITNETAGQEDFEIKLPTSPYSFEGHLISLKWALELRSKKGDSSKTLDITVTPNGKEISLPLIENESKRKPFSFRRSR